MKLAITAAALLVLTVGCDRVGTNPSTDDEKSVYAIGHDMGTKLQSLQLSDKEQKVLEKGIRDGMAGKEAVIDLREMFPKISEFIRSRSERITAEEVEGSEKFLKEVAERDDVITTESGLMYTVEKEGDGPSPTAEDTVRVHYHGTLRDGKVFDSSRDRGEPAEFKLNLVIRCWTEGLQLMKVGGKSTLYCPSDLAYGDRGAPPQISPGAALVFEVELLEIVSNESDSE